ncbi:hypothetical protein C9374_011239 [Naegleria lovaniensis]|uniref:THH1/TOM1/TOM3 domain-containing protein n=1 Tax=Naegleria lovaniensis TaxID=51637 RepID=A0AA88KRA4_NAELO|nr:uncharacterized protein C9374_011239 [Naegleria lovaniensis]KAG2392514.1 hypothetical protein C9374_011239 [Naegleria lovaniensis]
MSSPAELSLYDISKFLFYPSYELFQSSQNNNTNGTTTTNVTHASLSKLFPNSVENISSIVNSCFFIVVFTILIGVIGFIMYKARETTKRNHKILFFLLSVFILVQYFGLIFRLVYNGTALRVNQFVDLTQVTNLNSYQVVLWVFSVIENVLVISQMATILVIMSFIMAIFLKTVKMAGAMTAKTYKIIWWSVSVITAISATIFIALIIVNGVINLLLKMKILRTDVTPIYVILFLIFLGVMIMETVLFIAIGARLLHVVKKRSQNVSQAKSNQSSMNLAQSLQRPYIKIVGLIIGMIVSAFIQILAAVVSIFTSLYAGYLHIIDYFLQCFGVLVFAIFVLLLYNPLILQYEAKNENQTVPYQNQEMKEKEVHQIEQHINDQPVHQDTKV